MTDWIDRLERLNALRAAGHMSEAEFDAAKAQVLARRDAEPPPAAADRAQSAPRMPEPPRGAAAGYPDTPPALGPTAYPPPPSPAPGGNRTAVIAGLAALALLVAAAAAWLFMRGGDDATGLANIANVAGPAATLPRDPGLPPIGIGETLIWSGTTTEPVERQVGRMKVRITRTGSGDDIAPLVSVSYGDQTVSMAGEPVPPGSNHYITALQNRAGAMPVVLFQSFSGGAHCCTHIQLAGLSDGRLKVVDMGEWDGDRINPPTDRDGDGIADFVFTDPSFQGAFGPYASSGSVPKILNVVGGRVVDVSTRPGFRAQFADAMRVAAEGCNADADGASPGDACAAYVASAARLGQIDTAWRDMMTRYGADAEWTTGTGCAVEYRDGICPPGQTVTYRSYPEALLAFLRRTGYAPRDWQPVEVTAPYRGPETDPEAGQDRTPPDDTTGDGADDGAGRGSDTGKVDTSEE